MEDLGGVTVGEARQDKDTKTQDTESVKKISEGVGAFLELLPKRAR